MVADSPAEAASALGVSHGGRTSGATTAGAERRCAGIAGEAAAPSRAGGVGVPANHFAIFIVHPRASRRCQPKIIGWAPWDIAAGAKTGADSQWAAMRLRQASAWSSRFSTMFSNAPPSSSSTLLA